MRFSQAFLDDLKSRVRLSDVIGRSVRLKRQGREYAGLSPFTEEKTPSFFVNDDKGFFHCFSSGKHGDLISFLQETERLSFHEAVERLASEAGIELPKERAEDAAHVERRKLLLDATGAAARFFQAQLRRSNGRHARDYLDGRGLDDALIEEFGLGYAPASRTALRDHLSAKGVALEVMAEAGLVIRPEDGGEAYDRFRNRIMFPILGGRDDVIAFGGRALDPSAPAKYLNSPEGPLFHKSDVLYNYARARKALHDAKENALIVCEGYMDVIGLARAGVRNAAAPLGTALTERQIQLLWRSCDEPILCFDGDSAGRRAAHRSIDRALPMLQPGRSLRFAFLPDGQDPDDVTRNGGAAAFRRILGDAQPLVEVLWERETEAAPSDTPERRAALKKRFRELCAEIADREIREAYEIELKNRLDAYFAPAPPPQARRRDPSDRFAPRRGGRFADKGRPAGGATPELKRLRSATAGAQQRRRTEALLVLTLLNSPDILDRVAEDFSLVVLSDRALDALRTEILKVRALDGALDGPSLRDHLTTQGHGAAVQRLDDDKGLKIHAFAQAGADADMAETGWRAQAEPLSADAAISDELRDAAADMIREMTPESERRWRSLLEQKMTGAAAGADRARQEDHS